MKSIRLFCATVICFVMIGGLAFAAGMDDINAHKNCGHCGMDRGMFDFSRMMIEYSDGSVAATCSLHCAATDLAGSLDKTPKSIKVGDFKGRQLIDAEKAFWVVGGDRPGVMSKRGKWAFEKKEDAEAFMKTNHGTLVSFDEALKAAYADMPDDTKMIREKRQMKQMQMKMDGHGHDAKE